MELLCWPHLSTRSRRAMTRRKRRFSRRWNSQPYEYLPRGTLVRRLASKLGMTENQIYAQIDKERKHLLGLTP